MKKTRAPAYQWYPADWALDELASTLSNEAYGVFRRLYDVAWLNDGLPAEDDPVFAYSRCESRKKFDQLWMTIAPLFPPSPDGRRRNPQQEAERKKQRKNSRVKQLAAHKRWGHAHRRRNARASAHGDPSAPDVQCLALCSLLVNQDQDQKQEEQRDTDRRAPRPRMAKSVFDVRRHLLAATHRLLESGAPYVTGPLEEPNLSELAAELKTIAGVLGAEWDTARELQVIVDAALAQRARRRANEAYREGFTRRERRALGGRR